MSGLAPCEGVCVCVCDECECVCVCVKTSGKKRDDIYKWVYKKGVVH